MDAMSFVVTLDALEPVWLNISSPACDYTGVNATCVFNTRATQSGQHTLQVYTSMYGRTSAVKGFLWNYVVSMPVLKYVLEDASGNAACMLCEPGKDCTDPLHPVVAVNHWTSLASFQQGVFYSCPIAGACLGGMNASGVVLHMNGSVFQLVRDGEVLNHCDDGYVGLLCSASLCDVGYFLQYGACRCMSIISRQVNCDGDWHWMRDDCSCRSAVPLTERAAHRAAQSGCVLPANPGCFEQRV